MGTSYSLDKDIRYPTMHQCKLMVVTQIKESSGLFDYDNQKIYRQQLKLIHTGVVVRSIENHSVKIIQFDQLQNEKNLELLVPMFQISYVCQNYLIQSVQQQYLNIFGKQIPKKLIYLNVKSNQYLERKNSFQNSNYKVNQMNVGFMGFRLRHNDSIKVGKLVLEAMKVKGSEQTKEGNQDQAHQIEQPIRPGNCRICLCEDDGLIDDPLIDPCKCIGSVKSVHFKCLEKWLQSKCIKKQKSNISYLKMQNQIMCELCQKKLKMSYQIDNRQDELKINLLPTPPNNYMVLKKMYVQMMIDFNQKDTIRIGRSHQTDLRLNDISVSRVHAILKLDKDSNQFYLKDNKAKFGSLVQLKDGILLESSINGLQLQVDRNVIYLNVKKVKNYKKMIEKRQCKKQIGCFKLKNKHKDNKFDYLKQYQDFDKQYQQLDKNYNEICTEYIKKMVQIALQNDLQQESIKQNQVITKQAKQRQLTSNNFNSMIDNGDENDISSDNNSQGGSIDNQQQLQNDSIQIDINNHQQNQQQQDDQQDDQQNHIQDQNNHQQQQQQNQQQEQRRIENHSIDLNRQNENQNRQIQQNQNSIQVMNIPSNNNMNISQSNNINNFQDLSSEQSNTHGIVLSRYFGHQNNVQSRSSFMNNSNGNIGQIRRPQNMISNFNENAVINQNVDRRIDQEGNDGVNGRDDGVNIRNGGVNIRNVRNENQEQRDHSLNQGLEINSDFNISIENKSNRNN